MISAARFRASLALLASAGLLSATVGTVPAAADAQLTAIVGVNIRSGPSTSAGIVGGLYRGQTVTAVSSARGWTKIRFLGGSAYIASPYLTKGRLPAPTTASGTRVTTTAVNLRRGPGLSYGVIRVIGEGTRVALSGRTARRFAEVMVSARRGWISTRYLARAGSGLPVVTGTRVATADLLIRTTSSSKYRVVGEAKVGTRLAVTGTVQNGRAQIVWNSAVRWVTAKYLSAAAPASSTASGSVPKSWRQTEWRLTAKTIRVHRAVRAAFPEIKDVGGWYASNAGEHPLGRAIDVMLPGDYHSASARSLGFRIADWARAHARELEIMYVVWDQHIWNIQRDREGWRLMADRGSDSANHKNHVHISVLP